MIALVIYLYYYFYFIKKGFVPFIASLARAQMESATTEKKSGCSSIIVILSQRSGVHRLPAISPLNAIFVLTSIVYAADHPNELYLSLIPTLKQELNETFEFTRLLNRWGLWAGSEGGAVKTSLYFSAVTCQRVSHASHVSCMKCRNFFL